MSNPHNSNQQPPPDKTAAPNNRHAFGWNCKNCTFFHKVPGTRCSMCGELRGASRQEMRDFILGKPVAPVVTGNVVELLDESPKNHNSSPTRHNHKPPKPLPRPNPPKPTRNPYFKHKPNGFGNTNHTSSDQPNRAPAAVRNPYWLGKPGQGAGRVQQSSINATAIGESTLQKEHQQQQAQQHQQQAQHHQQQQQQQQAPPPPPPKQHSFFDKNTTQPATKTARPANKKKQPVIHHFAFAPGPVAYHPDHALTYIYPKHPDYPTRDYQKEITETALNYNTLVSLPTGLGKTHIAAVVMYNFWRWFPNGKVVFLAPTLPLVNQQIEACYKITGIPGSETAVLTGRLKAQERQTLWKSKRIFYCTPQTVQKDLLADGDQDNHVSFSKVVCLVLDEAHKATGEYAYTRVVELLEQHANAKFRIVGLSATPGTTIKAIQGVVEALRACKIESRNDSDPTVAPYLHEKKTELVICPRNTHQRKIGKALSDLVHPLLQRLREEKVLMHGTADTLTAYSIIRARQQYEQSCRNGRRMNGGLLSCFHATHTLIQIKNDCHQSIGVVKTKLLRLKSSPQKGILSTVVKSNEFSSLLESVLEANGGVEDVVDPKLAKLCELLKHHFERSNVGNQSSRAIVFAQFRDSVQEIVDCLESTLKPLVRCRYFVGQNKGNNNSNDEKVSGMKQAQQQKAIKDFRNNVFNVLVCTSIGEEGLDIGEVDLIVNYDVIRSPIRTIQRAGRTGRKRDGRVVCLIAEGPEEQTHKKRVEGERTLANALKNPKKFVMASHYPMLPHAPTLEYQMMQVHSKLNMKEVAGAQQTTPSAKIKAFSKDAWKLTLGEAEERQRSMGSNVVSLPDHVTWEKLKRFFCKNTFDPSKLPPGRYRHLSPHEREQRIKRRIEFRRQKRTSVGRNARILDLLQTDFGSIYATGTTKSGYRDILKIFPIEFVPQELNRLDESRTFGIRRKHMREQDKASIDTFPNKTPPPSLMQKTSHPGKENEMPSLISPKNSSASKNIPPLETIPKSSLKEEPEISRASHIRKDVMQDFISQKEPVVEPGNPKDSDPIELVQGREKLRSGVPPLDATKDVGKHEKVIFRLPTPPPSSDSSSGEDDCASESNTEAIPHPQHNTPQPEYMNKITTNVVPHQIAFEAHGGEKNLEQTVKNTEIFNEGSRRTHNEEKVGFRLPTPPPSSSSSGEDESESDEDTKVDEIAEIPFAKIQGRGESLLSGELEISSMPNINNGDGIDTAVMNLEDGKFKQVENDQSFSRTPPSDKKRKLSIGFEGGNDMPLSALKTKSNSSKNGRKDVIDVDDSDEDRPLISFNNKNKTQMKNEKDVPLISLSSKKKKIESANHGKILPRVSLGRNNFNSENHRAQGSSKKKRKETAGRESESEDDVPLVSFKNQDGSSKTSVEDNSDTLGTPCLKEHIDAIVHNQDKGLVANRLGQKRPRIMETPESTDNANLMSTSKLVQTQSQIVDHLRAGKVPKRLRIGTDDSDEENDMGCSTQHSVPDMTPSFLGNRSKFTIELEDWPNTTSASKTNGLEDTPASIKIGTKIGKHRTFDGLTDTPTLNRDGIAEEIVCQICSAGDSTNEDLIVLCDGCNMGFHKYCYPVDVDIESTEPWYCDACQHRSKTDQSANDDIVCTYCHKRDGVLRKDDTTWCHPLCLAFGSKLTSGSCSKCSLVGAVQCNACPITIHPHCALDSGWAIVRALGNKGQTAKYSLYCPKHNSDAGGSKSAKIRIIRNGAKSKANASPQLKVLKRKRTDACKQRPTLIPRGPTINDAEKSHIELLHDSDEEESLTQKQKERLKERRRQGIARFVLEEADIGSDQENDDDDEEEAIRRIEEEEAGYSQDSFINDNPDLTQSFSQDLLGRVDADAASTDFDYGATRRRDGGDNDYHRALDAQRERENQFKTPNFNRRMMRPDSENGDSVPSSQRGIGRMSFIRSVLEHHRQGGDCDQIEAEYKRLKAIHDNDEESQGRESTHGNVVIDLSTTVNNRAGNTRNVEATSNHTTITNAAALVDTVSTSIGLNINSTESHHQRSSTTKGALTAEQVARIEANRQAALRKRAQFQARNNLL